MPDRSAYRQSRRCRPVLFLAASHPQYCRVMQHVSVGAPDRDEVDAEHRAGRIRPSKAEVPDSLLITLPDSQKTEG